MSEPLPPLAQGQFSPHAGWHDAALAGRAYVFPSGRPGHCFDCNHLEIDRVRIRLDEAKARKVSTLACVVFGGRMES